MLESSSAPCGVTHCHLIHCSAKWGFYSAAGLHASEAPGALLDKAPHIQKVFESLWGIHHFLDHEEFPGNGGSLSDISSAGIPARSIECGKGPSPHRASIFLICKGTICSRCCQRTLSVQVSCQSVACKCNGYL